MSLESVGKSKLGMVVVSGLSAAVAYAVVGSLFNRRASLDKQLVTASSEMNKRCPFMVDKDTRLDTTVAGPGKRLSYMYTLVNVTSDQIDAEKFVGAMRPMLVNSVKTLDDMRRFREGKVTLVYNYRDKFGSAIVAIEITPSDYEQ